MERFLTTAQAAKILDLAPDSVRYLARNKRLTGIVVGRGQRLFRPADVEKLAKQRARERAKSAAA